MSNPLSYAYKKRIAELEREVERLKAEKRPAYRALAKKIASYLFTGVFKTKAKRLVLEHDGQHFDASGWCESAMADRIEQILKGEKWAPTAWMK